MTPNQISNATCSCTATVNSILLMEIKERAFGGAPRKRWFYPLKPRSVLLWKHWSWLSNELAISKRTRILLAQNHQRVIGLYQDLDFSESVGEVDYSFQYWNELAVCRPGQHRIHCSLKVLFENKNASFKARMGTVRKWGNFVFRLFLTDFP